MADPGYKVSGEHLKTFAGACTHAGERYHKLKGKVPDFGGFLDLPLLALGYGSDYDKVIDVVKQAIEALGGATGDSGTKLLKVAVAYEANEAAAAAALAAKHP